ncbi:electron carrier/ protein disulfide oxidoreductase [Anaeramoeba flamelloides]|uniref:Electron carrier/ protein disulfide oxidoreductase n=1 Tax=Anaeramoeba flamelloides TaxID=1746091 RepID=A0AAV8A3J5_9EUKA|nr:electron carrier/ protein disulfide oxidoreductase [Anaeramoeba flamelloides]
MSKSNPRFKKKGKTGVSRFISFKSNGNSIKELELILQDLHIKKQKLQSQLQDLKSLKTKIETFRERKKEAKVEKEVLKYKLDNIKNEIEKMKSFCTNKKSKQNYKLKWKGFVNLRNTKKKAQTTIQEQEKEKKKLIGKRKGNFYNKQNEKGGKNELDKLRTTNSSSVLNFDPKKVCLRELYLTTRFVERLLVKEDMKKQHLIDRSNLLEQFKKRKEQLNQLPLTKHEISWGLLCGTSENSKSIKKKLQKQERIIFQKKRKLEKLERQIQKSYFDLSNYHDGKTIFLSIKDRIREYEIRIKCEFVERQELINQIEELQEIISLNEDEDENEVEKDKQENKGIEMNIKNYIKHSQLGEIELMIGNGIMEKQNDDREDEKDPNERIKKDIFVNENEKNFENFILGHDSTSPTLSKKCFVQKDIKKQLKIQNSSLYNKSKKKELKKMKKPLKKKKKKKLIAIKKTTSQASKSHLLLPYYSKKDNPFHEFNQLKKPMNNVSSYIRSKKENNNDQQSFNKHLKTNSLLELFPQKDLDSYNKPLLQKQSQYYDSESTFITRIDKRDRRNLSSRSFCGYQNSPDSSQTTPNNNQKITIPSFLSMMKIPNAIDYFRQFLVENLKQENYLFFEDVKSFKTLCFSEKQMVKNAKRIYQRYIKEGSVFEININSLTRQKIIKQYEDKNFTINMFDEAQRWVFQHLKIECWVSFKLSPIYQKLIQYLEQNPQFLKNINTKLKSCKLTHHYHMRKALNEEFDFKGTTQKAHLIGEWLINSMISILIAYYSVSSKKINLKTISQSIPFRRFCLKTAQLQKIELKSLKNKKKRISFFLNLYNTLFLHSLILNGKPKGKINILKFKNKSIYLLNNNYYSLNDILHGILRANSKEKSLSAYFKSDDQRSKLSLKKIDPRIHFAIINFPINNSKIKVYSEVNLDIFYLFVFIGSVLALILTISHLPSAKFNRNVILFVNSFSDLFLYCAFVFVVLSIIRVHAIIVEVDSSKLPTHEAVFQKIFILIFAMFFTMAVIFPILIIKTKNEIQYKIEIAYNFSCAFISIVITIVLAIYTNKFRRKLFHTNISLYYFTKRIVVIVLLSFLCYLIQLVFLLVNQTMRSRGGEYSLNNLRSQITFFFGEILEILPIWFVIIFVFKGVGSQKDQGLRESEQLIQNNFSSSMSDDI